MDGIERLRDVKAAQWEESITKRMKLRRQEVETLKRLRVKKIKRQSRKIKKSKNRNWNQNLNSTNY